MQWGNDIYHQLIFMDVESKDYLDKSGTQNANYTYNLYWKTHWEGLEMVLFFNTLCFA